jgi:hypothetical protein
MHGAILFFDLTSVGKIEVIAFAIVSEKNALVEAEKQRSLT